MKKLLVTGGSHAELPMIEAAKKMGWYVITTGMNEGGQGHLAADKYMKGDFSDKEFVYELAKSESVDAIVSGANDFAYLSTAYACEKLNLPGHDSLDVARKIHIKSEFRKLTASLGIKSPKMIECKDLNSCKKATEEIGFPLMVKPVDLTGGKGVKACFSLSDVENAIEEAMGVTRESYIILEECIQGSCHGFTSLIKDGQVVWHMVDNEQYGANKYLVLGACSPSDIPQQAEFTLINDVEKIAKNCKLVDGLFHVQFILDKDNYPVMIDPCRRMPGDLYILLAKYVTGVDYPLEILKAECGMELASSYCKQYNFIARECIMIEKSGILKAVHIEEELKKYIIYQNMFYHIGEEVTDPMKYKAGILIMRFDSCCEMKETLQHFSELVWIETE